MAPPSWIRRSIDVIINNLILRVKNFNLYYEVLPYLKENFKLTFFFHKKKNNKRVLQLWVLLQC